MRLNVIRKASTSCVAIILLMVAQVASTQYSWIFYEPEVPAKLQKTNV